jgi:hypothetical protein
MKKKCEQNVCVAKTVFEGNFADYRPVQYEIHLEEMCIGGINEETAEFIYLQLGKFLEEKEGGAS